MDIRKQVGSNIQKLRQEAKISQEELGSRIDADQAYISRLEAGELNPTLDTLALLAGALSQDIANLFKDS